jgi:formylmethanofuran dehydrogenase subunit B
MFPAGGPRTPQDDPVDHVTCLGCGCACDDITVRVSSGRITETVNACDRGRGWFGDGAIASASHVDGRESTFGAALDAVAAMLASARAPLIYVAPELSCEAQRGVTALADRLRARLESVTGDTALPSILAAQERGRAGATLGEVRNRSDVIVFWGVDPDVRYPRYRTRYAPEPAGVHVPEGRRGRQVIAVDIGDDRGPADADIRVSVGVDEEVALLTAVTALIRQPGVVFGEPLQSRATSLAAVLTAARYSTIVADAELPSRQPLPHTRSAEADHFGFPFRDPQRAAALIALSQALNGPSRSALSTLREGGNRTGADAVLTSQTGYPTAIDFSRGFPTYRPLDRDQRADATLIVGDAAGIPSATLDRLAQSRLAIIGPRASSHPAAHVAIDTGIAGIHCGGTALRMDDVPLPLRPSIDGQRDPADVVRALLTRLQR